MATARETANGLLRKIEKEDYMILMATITLDDSKEHYPLIECVYTKHGTYPPEDNKENDLTIKSWIFENNKWKDLNSEVNEKWVTK